MKPSNCSPPFSCSSCHQSTPPTISSYCSHVRIEAPAPVPWLTLHHSKLGDSIEHVGDQFNILASQVLELSSNNLILHFTSASPPPIFLHSSHIDLLTVSQPQDLCTCSSLFLEHCSPQIFLCMVHFILFTFSLSPSLISPFKISLVCTTTNISP